MTRPERRTTRELSASALAAAVYGSIVATAFLAALRETRASSSESALSLLSTMGVFWLAHVWSQITGERIHEGTRLAPSVVLGVARNEWPLIEASLAPTVVLLFGWSGLLADRTALTAALVVCGLQLVLWGFVSGRRAHDRALRAVLSGVVNGALGLSLVALESLVLH